MKITYRLFMPLVITGLFLLSRVVVATITSTELSMPPTYLWVIFAACIIGIIYAVLRPVAKLIKTDDTNKDYISICIIVLTFGINNAFFIVETFKLLGIKHA